MACEEIHVNDIGTVFRGTVYEDCDAQTLVDISTASVMVMYFQKPDGSVVTQTAVFSTDGTDGKMQYTTIASDLDQAGSWKMQGKVTLPAGDWHTDIHKFKVLSNLA